MPPTGSSDLSASLRAPVLSLLNSRTYPKTLCPSEVARSLSTTDLSSLGAASWRDLMPALRELAFKMRDEGVLEVLQRGEVSRQRAEEVRGPIRLRLVREGGVRGEEGDE